MPSIATSSASLSSDFPLAASTFGTWTSGICAIVPQPFRIAVADRDERPLNVVADDGSVVPALRHADRSAHSAAMLARAGVLRRSGGVVRPQTIERRVESLEDRVTRLEELPARVDDLTGQILQLRGETAATTLARAGRSEERRVGK